MSEENSLGVLLREARERRGETLEQAQQQTAISPNLLRELENGEFRVEPVYARLAAANYAAHLGLDPEEVTARFDRQFGRPDIPAPSTSLGRVRSSFPTRNGKVPAVWVIAAAAAIVVAVLLAILFSGGLEDPAPPSAGAEIPPALPLEDDGDPFLGAEPDPFGGTAGIAALEINSAPLTETSIASDSTDAGGGETPEVDFFEEPGTVPVPGESVSGTALQEEPEDARSLGAPDLAPLLVLRAEAVDSTWVRIVWDGGAGAAEEIIPVGESRQWEAADSFLVFAGRPHGVRFYLQGQLLGGGRLGEPSRVLRFRASADELVLLGADLTPLSAVPLPDPDAAASPGEPRTR